MLPSSPTVELLARYEERGGTAAAEGSLIITHHTVCEKVDTGQKRKNTVIIIL
jgi:hypothetical protein